MSEEEKTTTEAPKDEKPSFSFPIAAPSKKPDDDDDDEGENEVVKEEESTATFVPVVNLEEVEVKSGEEDEEAVYSIRGKLFVFGETLLDKGTGKKTWRERGIGEAKILRHKEHQRIRFLMRQEKTMKLIANHAVDPRIRLESNAGSDRSWVWSAFDFSEGELVETIFALRFADSDIANTFKEKFTQSQKDMDALLKGQDQTDADGGAAADEAADALANLKTSE